MEPRTGMDDEAAGLNLGVPWCHPVSLTTKQNGGPNSFRPSRMPGVSTLDPWGPGFGWFNKPACPPTFRVSRTSADQAANE